MSYQDQVGEKKYIPNIVLKFKGKYWSIRQPDSGLIAEHPGLLDQVVINPTKVDPFNANTTINSYTFKLIDKDRVVSALFNGVTSFFQNEKVEIWIGRSMVSMPFADYMKLPDTFVTNVSRDNNSYNFQSTEIKNRADRPAFNDQNKLEVNIVAATTIIDVAAPFTIDTPASGLIKIGEEFISYTGIDLVNNRFLNCIRGEKNSIPSDHEEGTTIYFVDDVTGNPIDIILKLLVSSGGGSVYDTLTDGAAIDSTLINIDSFERVRDEFFSGQQYNLSLYGITSILKFIEAELLYPNELRLVTDNTSKVSLSLLNRKFFNDDLPVFTENTILKQPKYEVKDGQLINTVSIEYDYAEGTGKYRKVLKLTDDESVSVFGPRETKVIKVKGIRDILDGATIARNIAERFLSRFSFPKPEISFSSQMDMSLVNLVDKAEVNSSQIPNQFGELDFVETLEVLERGINWKTGEVRFKLAFTSFTGIRECHLAPSDKVINQPDGFKVTVGAGRGALYRVGWKMRLYNDGTREYLHSDIYTIKSIVGDVIEFEEELDVSSAESILLTEDGFYLLQENGDPIVLETGSGGALRIMFADYDDVAPTQKRYCFINQNGLNFNDNTKPFQVTL